MSKYINLIEIGAAYVVGYYSTKFLATYMNPPTQRVMSKEAFRFMNTPPTMDWWKSKTNAKLRAYVQAQDVYDRCNQPKNDKRCQETYDEWKRSVKECNMEVCITL
jgi:hypothetical protein